MNDSSFLVARVLPESVGDDLAWLQSGQPPYDPVDPLDFLAGEEIESVYELYKTQYSRLDPELNVQMPEALLEFNCWVLIVNETGAVLAFACYKTMPHGLKLGLIASGDSKRGKDALNTLLRVGLNVPGVYGEVSGAIEHLAAGYAPEIPAEQAGRVLDKQVEPDDDGMHYRREITNVGFKTKLLMGKPILND